MNIKDLAAVAILAAVIGGITGAIFTSALTDNEMPEKVTIKELTVDKLNAASIDADEFVSKDGETLSLSIKNGHIQTTKSIVAGEIRGKRLIGNGVFVIPNDPKTAFAQCQVLAQMLAGKGGGMIYIHNAKGAYSPAGGPVKEGNVLYMGYNDLGLPSLFSQQVAQGEKGKLYLIKSAVKKKEDPKAEEKKTTKKKSRR
ncbi:MAG: hypothetical protein ACYTFY_17770 [Planctomycetota bacterium]|jgi:hypothetical protein